jgi:hypothetical protein
MGGRWKRAVVLAILALAVAGSGCGGGSGSTDAATTSDPLAAYPEGPTREFVVPGGDNVIQTFGREATPAEREQASRVIHKWMQARAVQDWKKDCSYWSKAARKTITEDAHSVTDGRVKNCPQALAYFGHDASGDYKNNLDGPIDSLRLGEGHGYAQYHGSDGRDWIVPVDGEGGKWLVATATPIERNK